MALLFPCERVQSVVTSVEVWGAVPGAQQEVGGMSCENTHDWEATSQRLYSIFYILGVFAAGHELKPFKYGTAGVT